MKRFTSLILIVLITTSLSFASGKDPLAIMTTAQIAFGLDIFKVAAKQSDADNTLISPISLEKSLGALHLGSRIEVTSALETVLHIEQIPPYQFYIGMTALQESLQYCDPRLAISSSIWIQQGTPVRPEWKTSAKDYYGTDTMATNFNSPQGTQVLNHWITQTVAGALSSPFSPPKKNHVFLVDTCSYHGIWATGFDPAQTTNRRFLTRNNTTVLIPMMQKTEQYGYLKGNGFQAVSLHFSGQRLALYLFLPDQSLNAFFTRLNPYSWSRWMLMFKPKMGTVCLPKLDIYFSQKMDDPLRNLGLGIAFSERANLGGIGDDLRLSGVQSHLHFKIDETGSQSSTHIQVIESDPTPTTPFLLVFNRPYFFAIRDTLTGAIVMMGSIGNPAKMMSKA